MSGEMKPCAHCGAVAILASIPQRARSRPRYSVVCGGTPACRASVAMYGPAGFITETEAIAAWNRRSPDPELVEALESVLFEDSDKAEVQRIADRVKAVALLSRIREGGDA